MIDYLLRFDAEAEAIAALQDLRVTPTSFSGELLVERWADTVMPVALVTADAVYGDPVEMMPVVISPRATLPGFWLIVRGTDEPVGTVATLGPAGVVATSDDAILGARLDPVWAGMPSVPLAMVPAVEPEPQPVPDGPTLSDWRVALIQMGRFSDVKAAVETARDSGAVEGLIAWERFEYANNVYRAELLRLAPVFGFTEAEIDESLRGAALVSQTMGASA